MGKTKSPITKIFASFLVFIHIIFYSLYGVSFAEEVPVSELTGTAEPGSGSSSPPQISPDDLAGMSSSISPMSGGDAVIPPMNAFQSFQVEPSTGMASTSIPIAVPPARNGIQPNISINYSSGNGNDVCGVGWTLNLGYIERSTKHGIPTYNDLEDTFVFYSQGGSVELVPIGSGEYRAKQEGAFMKFKYNGSYWDVWDKFGTKYQFGTDDNSKIYNGGKIFRWALKQVFDPHQNYLGIRYLKDANQLYPESILYGGNFQADFVLVYNVNFQYEDRPDKIITYKAGASLGKIITQKRLSYIEINFVPDSVLISKYAFEYKQSLYTKRSLLTKATQIGPDGKTSFPPTIFKYQEDKITYTFKSTNANSGDNLWNVRFGYRDWGSEQGASISPGHDLPWGKTYTEPQHTEPAISWSASSDGNLHLSANMDYFFHAWTFLYVKNDTTLTIPASGNCFPGYYLNGDWNPSNVHNFNEPVKLKAGYNLIDITGYNQQGSFTFDLNLPLANNVDLMNSSQLIIPQLGADFNGDGNTDLGTFYSSTGNWNVALSTRTDFSPKATWVEGFNPNWTPMLGDFDGNGKIDACSFNRNTGEWQVALSNGKDGFASPSAWLANFGDTSISPIMGDFNSDGKQDIGYFVENQGDWHIALSKDNSFNPKGVWLSGFKPNTKPHTGDFNGDGITDLCAFDNSSGDWFVAIGNGTGFEKYDLQWASGFAANKQNEIFTIDYDQDGLTDIGYFDKPNAKLVVMRSTGESFVEQADWVKDIALVDRDIQVQFGDFNGDGIIDPYFCNPYTSVTQQAVSFGKTYDLLCYISNGLGATTTIKYRPSTAYYNVDNNQIPTLPFVIQTVGYVANEEGSGGSPSMSQYYWYWDGLYDTQQKDFRGFGYVKVADKEGNYNWLSFHQDEIKKGKLYYAYTCDKDRVLYTLIDRTWANREIHPGCGDYFVYLEKEINRTQDGEFLDSKTTIAQYQYDAFGNITKIENLGETDIFGNDIGTDKKTIETEYTQPNLSKWIVGLPAHAIVYDYFGNKISEKWFYYDGSTSLTIPPEKGLLTKEEAWFYNPVAQEEKRISSTYEYDSWGMLVKSIDPKGNPITTSYDDFDENSNGAIDLNEKTYHIYPRSVTNVLGQIMRSHYDIKTGQIIKSIDPNGQITRSQYDALGRPIKIIGPLDTDENPGITYQYQFPTQNMLPNSSFETWSNGIAFVNPYGGGPDGWYISGSMYPTLTRNYENKHNGNYSACLDAPSNAFGQIVYDYLFPTAAVPEHYIGKTYTFACWVKTDIPNKVNLELLFHTDFGSFTSNSHSGSGDWELLSVTGTIPQGANYFRTNCMTYSGSTAYFDDAILVEGTNIDEPFYKVIAKQKINYDNQPDYQETYQFYDGLGRLIQTKRDAQDQTKQIVSGKAVYDFRGNVKEKYLPFLASKSDQFDKTQPQDLPKATFEYDCLGRLTKTINPDQTYSTIQYYHWSTTIIDENGHKKVSYNDAFGRLTKVEEYIGDSDSGYSLYATTQYTYDAQDNLIQVKDAHGNITAISYDSFGRKIAMDDPDMGHWEYKYDDLGNLLEQTDAKGQTIKFTYDAINRLTAKSLRGASPEAGDEAISTYSYDQPNSISSDNYIGRLVKVTDNSGQTEFAYDVLGREIKTTKRISTTEYQVSREYDALDRLTRLTYPDSEVVHYDYNPQGIDKVYTQRTTQDAGRTTYYYVSEVVYNQNDQITKLVYGNGDTRNYTYDEKTLRLTNLTTQNAQLTTLQDLNYQFDSIGNIKQIEDIAHSSIQYFIYDELNRLTQAQGNYGTENYSYDEIGNILQKGDLTLTYDQSGNAGPHAVTSLRGTAGADAISFTYDANGNLSQKGGQTFKYDAENRLVESSSIVSDPQIIEIQLTTGWNFFSLPIIPTDPSINSVIASISDKVEQISSYNPGTSDFKHYVKEAGYNQLTEFKYGQGYEIYVTENCALTIPGYYPQERKVHILQDNKWNLIGSIPYEMSPDEALNIGIPIKYDYLKIYNKQTGAFEDIARTDKLKPKEAYFIHLNQSTMIIFSPPLMEAKTTFLYDGDGGRVKKVTKEGATTYVGSLYEERLANSGERLAVKHIFAGANRICTISSLRGTAGAEAISTHYFHGDHLGSSSVITDEQGNQVSYTEYKPYGEVYRQQGSYDTPYKFTGKELDSTTGLYFYGARYYDPVIGRFTQPDTIVQDPSNPQTLNRYSYCNNNPVNYVDPTGHGWFKKFWQSIVGVATTVLSIIAPPLAPAMWAINMAISAYTAVDTGNIAGFIGGMVGGAVFGAIGKSLATSISASLGEAAFSFGGGFLHGAIEFGIAGFGSGFVGGLAGGVGFEGALALGGMGAAGGAIMGGVIQGSYMAGWQDTLHGTSRAEVYEAGIKRLHALSAKNLDTTAIVGSRPLGDPKNSSIARHRYIRGRAGRFEMGPDQTTKLIEINGENSLPRTEQYLKNFSSQVIETTLAVNQSGFDKSIQLYKAAWVGTRYSPAIYNSNYAVNTIMYGSGANIPENLAFSPEGIDPFSN